MIILWNILKFVILVVITFFTCQIITDGKKRISYIGVLLICFSSAVVEYFNSRSCEALIFSELIFIGFSNIINNFKLIYLNILFISLRYYRFFDFFKC